MPTSTAFLLQICLASSVANTILLHTHAAASVVATRRTRRIHRTRSFPPALSTCWIPATVAASHQRGINQYLLSRRIDRQTSSSRYGSAGRVSGRTSDLLPTSWRRPVVQIVRTTSRFPPPPATTILITSPSGRKRIYSPTAVETPTGEDPGTCPNFLGSNAPVCISEPGPPSKIPSQIMPGPVTATSARSIAQVLSASTTASTTQPATMPAPDVNPRTMDGSGKHSAYAEPRQSTDSNKQPSRSPSSASRNRLSLTLPIAPPTSNSARHQTPGSAAHTSFPSTPLDSWTSSLASPGHPADLVVAIAAQEHRVFELKEDLKRAQHNLNTLRRQLAKKGGHQHPSINTLSAGTADPNSSQDERAQRPSVDLDRRRAVLAAHQQQGQQSDGKKRIFRGHHARALSLVSPTQSASASELDDMDDGQDSASISSVATAPSNAPAPSTYQRNQSTLSKRATWNINPDRNSSSGLEQFTDMKQIKQIAGDFKTGLWTFVEDIRQATVGDEAVNGQAVRPPTNPVTTRPIRSTAAELDGGDTIRASATARPDVSTLFPEAGSKAMSQESTTTSAAQRTGASRRDSGNKRVSYTPPLSEEMKDDDSPDWDSPTVVPSPETPEGSIPNRGLGAIEQAIHKIYPLSFKRVATNLIHTLENSLEKTLVASPEGFNATSTTANGGFDPTLAYPSATA